MFPDSRKYLVDRRPRDAVEFFQTADFIFAGLPKLPDLPPAMMRKPDVFVHDHVYRILSLKIVDSVNNASISYRYVERG